MQQHTGSLDLGPIGLDINLRIGQIQSTLEQLTEAVSSAGDRLGDTVSGAVSTLRDAGISHLKQNRECCERGDSACCDSGAQSLYQSVVGQLQAAAAQGAEAARSLLGELGEKIQAAGQKMQETAQPEGLSGEDPEFQAQTH